MRCQEAHGMNIQQLTCFRNVALLKSYTKAAEAMDISRSAINQNIKELEGDLSVTLFYFRDGSVELTQSGETLLPYADRLVYIFDDANATVSGMLQESKKIRICYSSTLAHTIFPLLFRKIYDENILSPDELELIRTPILDDVMDKLDNGDADVAFFVDQPSNNFEFVPIAKDQIYFVLPADHPLAVHGRLRPSDLKDEIFVTPSINNYNHSSYLQAMVDIIFSSENIRPKFSEHSALLPYRYLYVLLENGYTISPRYPLDPCLKEIEIDSSYCRRNIYMIWPKKRKPSYRTRLFLDYCIDFFRDKTEMTFEEILRSEEGLA